MAVLWSAVGGWNPCIPVLAFLERPFKSRMHSASPGVVGTGAARLQVNGCAVVCQSILQALQLVVAGRPVVQRPAVLRVDAQRPRVVRNRSLKVPLHCSAACIKPRLLSFCGLSSCSPSMSVSCLAGKGLAGLTSFRSA